MRELVQVLLIEDNDVDVEAVQRAFDRHRIENPLVVARDGREGLDALHEGKVSKPLIVLLDLNLPKMNGFEFLENLRADPKLTETVVLVLTTSNREDDKARAYRHHIAGYVVKSEVGQSAEKLASLLAAYFRVVALPVGRG